MVITKECLEEYYINQNLSLKQCGKLMKCRSERVREKLVEFGIPVKHNPAVRIHAEYIIKGEAYKCCNKCGQTKLLSDFRKDSSNNSGYKSYCIQCDIVIKAMGRRQSNPNMKGYVSQTDIKDKYIEQWMKDKQVVVFYLLLVELFQDEIVQLIKDYKRQCESKSKYSHEWYKKYYRENRESILYRQRTRYANNPAIQFYNRQKRHKRKALERQQVATLTWEQWRECLSYFNHECVYCGSTDDITQEHVIPLSKGGNYTKDNIVPACSCCNLGRRAEDLIVWYKQQLFFNPKKLSRLMKWHYEIGQTGSVSYGKVMRWK